MRSISLLGRLLVTAAIILGVASLSCSMSKPGNEASTAAHQDPVARGRYLVTIMSCNDCHTPGYFYGAPDTLRRLSGSDLGWVGPWAWCTRAISRPIPRPASATGRPRRSFTRCEPATRRTARSSRRSCRG
jgi:hypothetical protein